MRRDPRAPGRLSDDDVAEILLAGPAATLAELAHRFGVTTSTISVIRHRQSKRAIRIAARLGLIKPRARRCWSPSGGEQVAPAYVVATKAAVIGMGCCQPRPRRGRLTEDA